MASVFTRSDTVGFGVYDEDRFEESRRRELARQLKSRITGEVEFSPRARAQYATDASNYRVLPSVIAYPRNADEVVAIVKTARDFGEPVTSRGGGTSVAGNAIGTGVVIDYSRHMNKILSIDPDNSTATVEPGVILSDLQKEAARFGLRFGPDPSTQNRATLGGMIGNNACGPHAVAYGRTSDNVLSLACIDGNGRMFRAGSDTGSSDAARSNPASSDAAASSRAESKMADADTRDSNTVSENGRSRRIRPYGVSQFPQLDALVAKNLSPIRKHFGRFGRQVSGYSLEHLLPERGGDLAKFLTGSEGTLVQITQATVRLVPVAQKPMLVVLGYPDMPTAADAVPAILEYKPLAIEGMDAELVNVVRRHKGHVPSLPEGKGWLMIEVGAFEGEDRSIVAERARAIAQVGNTDSVRIREAGPEATEVWRIRADGAGLGGRTPEGHPAWPGWEDSAVPPEQLGNYLRDLQALMDELDLSGLMYGHFGDGCMHVRIDFPFASDGTPVFREFMERATDIVVRYGGSLSGEHGDGRARSELLPRMYPPELMELFAQVKGFFDPHNRFNPGVLVDPLPIDTDLRRPAARALGYAGGFHFHEDDGDFTNALHRCTGVGNCRADRMDSGFFMCPSYQATHDEKDVTRGRVRVLQEVAQGKLIKDFASTAVREALDLCLGCKACSADCPTGVDVARYKSESLYRGYKGKIRPRTHYVLGNLPVLARIVSGIPGMARFANAVMDISLLRRAAFTVAGIDTRRAMPRFATRSFSKTAPGLGIESLERDWLEHNYAGGGYDAHRERDKRYVLLWADSFSETLDTRGAQSMVALLQRNGYTVLIPDEDACCGLTWITTGQLSIAKRKLRALMDTLAPFAASGIPIVGVEPSCTAVLRDDIRDLFPDDPRSGLLARGTFTLAELLTDEHFGPGTQLTIANLNGKHIIAQPHCHHYSVMGWKADAELLRMAGAQVETLSGCCGLAGNFGMERGHYDVSVKIAQRQLLPALHRAGEGAVYLADGFSCRTQAQQLAGVDGVHLATLLLGE
ncbi:MAG: FAD-linked oxidase C-terminal domain-containing protein [Actinomycetaceae bacterium]|nr:FAD-binding protein [Arcanobacterium sp.]MDD7504923.1 FAD-linked oxidase C-terminal domain-containing protein [Actinomycetaceae bacterium]MDY6143269.1 FAD-linked oxidase C-terminal domain-containing protein [Arcanobacterium sp.]